MLHFAGILVITMLKNIDVVYTDTNQSKEEIIPVNISQELGPRIRFGWPSELGSYPWMVYLYHVVRKRRRACGGSIISHRHVLSAAHCVHGARVETMKVRVSELNLEKNPDCEWEMWNIQFFSRGCDSYIREYSVEKFTVYGTFEWVKFPSNDICIIKVSEDIAFNKFVNKISLPFGDVDFRLWGFAGMQLVTCGWGNLNEENVPERSTILMETVIKGVSETKCKARYEHADPNFAKNLFPGHICAGSSAESGTCSGDSGGPLMYFDETKKPYLIGVVSAGLKCIPYNPVDVPDVFMRVDYYKDWILSNMQ